MTCPSCKGTGKIIGVFPVYAPKTPRRERKPVIEMPCDFCGGSGIVDDRVAEWKKVGENLRAARITAGLSLKKAALILGMSVLTLSHMERGSIEPATPIVERYALAALDGKEKS